MTISPAEATARYRARHPERVKVRRATIYRDKEAAATRARKNTPEGWAKSRVVALRYKAKKLGLEFTITWKDILPPERCPVFGTRLALISEGRRGFIAQPNTASVDRKHSDRGYTPDNVCVISVRANLLKKDATRWEIDLLAEWMRKECRS